jgi:type I restriction-modification system DNA methylase subunit
VMAAGKQMNQTAFRSGTLSARNRARRRNRTVTGFSRRSCTSRPCIKDYVLLDPAAGSGNFLTESYISIRRLENEAIREKTGGQIIFGSEDFNNPIKVSIQQFFGCEILDFAVTVAKTALWIAESQMLEETKSILYGFNQDFLPLKTYVNITEGNALRLDWNKIVDKNKLSYIMGNPPFVGASMMSKEQKDEITSLFEKVKRANSIDYVGGWYYKATEFIQGTNIRCAFVSTNSITQGEQVAPL